MDLQAEKRSLFEAVIEQAIPQKAFMAFANKRGVNVEPYVLQRWENNFYSKVDMKYPKQPRLCNKFCIGADPEFVLYGESVGAHRYVHAEELGMTTLEAFGADMNGRLAELRAYPSPYVLEVVASLCDTLRWMSVAYPQTLRVRWLAPAFINDAGGGRGGDGVGGHVHIGRKRSDYAEVIKNLDALSAFLQSLLCWDATGQQARTMNTAYGKPGDVRLQEHGYEYRSMPTWMDTPWSAYLTLVLSKLCVYYPMRNVWGKHTSKESHLTVIRNLLSKYAPEDDDARIALTCFQKVGLPSYVGHDMKASWGVPVLKEERSAVDTLVNKALKNRYYYPPVIPPSRTTMEELFAYFVHTKGIPRTIPKPTWETFVLPENVHKIDIQNHVAGVPECAQGLLSKYVQFRFESNRDGAAIVLNYNPSHTFNIPKISKAFGEIGHRFVARPRGTSEDYSDSGNQRQTTLQFPSLTTGGRGSSFVVDKERVTRIREVLTKSGLFPIARHSDIKKLDATDFSEKKKVPQELGKYVASFVGTKGDV